MMNAKRSSGYNLTRYVFLVPAVVVLLLTFSLSKAEVAKHTFKTIATAISHVAIVNNNENSIKRSVSTTITHTKPVAAKAAVKKVNTGADTIYSARAKNGRKSFMVTADTSPDSINYVLNGQKSSKEEVKAVDPERIKSVELVNAKSAKEFYPELDNDRQVMFVTTEDSEAGKKLKEKMDKTMRNGAIANNMSINYSSNTAPAATTGTTVTYSINSSSSDGVSSDSEGSKNVSAVTVTGVNPKVSTKVATTIKGQVYVAAKPVHDVVIASDDAAPEVITVKGYKRLATIDGKPAKIYVRGMNDDDNDQLTIQGKGHPIFIIDGKEVQSVKNLNPNDIKSISVLKNGTAEKKYGEKGKNGVIEITTKKK
ncbi:MAG: TonB-dependent receptor plug domain-containing protein [Bacteroidetes bacterium]|nr:TonB-dependent receptor plug domain-containing protein [Bacteroidota bacterium]